MTHEEHNAADWLAVKHFAKTAVGGVGGKQDAGWYVIRVCPCHFGERVTLPYTSEPRAKQAQRVMLMLRAS